MLVALALPPAILAAEKIVWKPVVLSLLKVDGKPAKIWNVYVAQKKEHLVLVQLGRRNLVLDTELREVIEIAPAAIQRKGKDLQWERAETANTENTEGICGFKCVLILG